MWLRFIDYYSFTVSLLKLLKLRITATLGAEALLPKPLPVGRPTIMFYLFGMILPRGALVMGILVDIFLSSAKLSVLIFVMTCLDEGKARPPPYLRLLLEYCCADARVSKVGWLLFMVD